VLPDVFFLRTMTDRREPPTAKGTIVAPDPLAALAPSTATSVEPPMRARLGSQVTTVAAANAAVAGLGFVGSVLVLPHALDQHAFAAASLFLAAFQCLQEVLGRSLYWATMRLCPVAEAEQPGGGARMLASAWHLQLRFIVLGGAA